MKCIYCNLLRFLAYAFIICVCLPACQTKTLQQESSYKHDLDNQIDGFWKSHAYGYYIEIKNRRLTLYDYNEISCFASILSTKRRGKWIDANTFNVEVTIAGYLQTSYAVQFAPELDRIILHRADTVAPIVAERIDSLPAHCKTDSSFSYKDILEIFYHTLYENHINRDAIIDALNPVKNSDLIGNSEDTQLFNVLSQVFLKLNDPHSLIHTIDGDLYFSGDQHLGVNYKHMEFRKQNVQNKYCQHKLTQYIEDLVFFCYLEGDFAYLRINAFTDFAHSLDFSKNNKKFDQTLDDIFSNLEPTKTLVIDLRFNSGGSDALALMLAGRLTAETYLAYYKSAKISGEDEVFTEKHAVYVEPHSKPFVGPVILLTDPYTMSAAETFVLSTMGRTPETCRIGRPTRGAFSDILPKRLPNGWVLGFSNERYHDAKGTDYENIGILPDKVTQLVSLSELDNDLEVALSISSEYQPEHCRRQSKYVLD